jgi:hypothetical protein
MGKKRKDVIMLICPGCGDEAEYDDGYDFYECDCGEEFTHPNYVPPPPPPRRRRYRAFSGGGESNAFQSSIVPGEGFVGRLLGF